VPDPDQPEVCVVIPTRNRAGRLGRSLAAALGQEDVDVEVVVVDDGSTDATPYWLAQVASLGVRTVRHPVGRGLPQARNAGIAAARGRWIAFLDDDDLWSPRKLRVQLDALARTDASWGYAAAVLVGDDLAPFGSEPSPDPDDLLDRLLVEQVIPAGSSNVIVRADVVRRLGGFDEGLANLADWDLWLRLAAELRPAASPGVLVACVQHDDNMHGRQDLHRFFAELDSFVARHAALRSARGLVFDERPFVQWVAEARTRAHRPWSAGLVHVRDGLRHRDPVSAWRAARSLFDPRSLRSRLGGGPLPSPPWLMEYAARTGPGRGQERKDA
jgi:glycosyltransferase involved in cell wall biosynthesis